MSGINQPEWPIKARTYQIEEINGMKVTGARYNAGWNDCLDACITAFNDWLKKQKLIVLPERKECLGNPELGYPFPDFDKGFNAAIDEFLRLNPQIRRDKE